MIVRLYSVHLLHAYPIVPHSHTNSTATVDEYLYAIYPPGTVMSQLLHSLTDSKNKKKSRVLKADIFRYTILLHKGGIYADADTASVRKFDEWGRDALDMVCLDVLSPLLFLVSVMTDLRCCSHPHSFTIA